MENNSVNSVEPDSAAPAAKDVILNLNFVPDWARKPPETNYFDHDTGEEPERHERRGRPERRWQDSRERRKDRKPAGRRDERPRHRDRPAREPSQWVEPPPVNVRFLPQHRNLSEVIRRIRLSKRCYPLLQVAGLFISNPGSCEVRIEVDSEAKDRFLLQCRICGVAAVSEEGLGRHMLHQHMDEFFVKEEKVGDAPGGKFTCVMQCGLSGVLIGPPNHHSTAEKIKEIHAARYAHMTEAEYKSHIKTLHEPEKIEQWKEQSRKSVAYRLKTAAADAKPLNWLEAESYFRKNIIPAQLVKARKVSLSGSIARGIQDRGLAIAVRDAWQQESRFPGSLLSALRGAFHNKRLHLFKAGKNVVFVSDIEPAPLDPGAAIPSIRDVLLYLKDHPGCTRENLVNALRPGFTAESQEAKEILSPLTWLIEKGHIIEFFDGTLAVIGGRPVSRRGREEDTTTAVQSDAQKEVPQGSSANGQQADQSPVSV
jgi:hypothetical protein